MITYTTEKQFTQEQAESLFLSVGWLSGKYPKKLYQALCGSSLVMTAWDGDRLVGLIRGLDDGSMLAYLHYLLVHPDYQGQGIAAELLRRIKEHYKDYLYIELMPEERKNVAFYQKHGFQIMEGSTPMLICHAGTGVFQDHAK